MALTINGVTATTEQRAELRTEIGADGGTVEETVSTTTYTLTAADFSGKTKVFTNAAGCLVTAPAGLSLAAGRVVTLRQSVGAGQFTLQGDGTSTIAAMGGSLVSSGERARVIVAAIGADAFEAVGQLGAPGAVKDFTSRALTADDYADTLICASAQTATVNVGLPSGFGCEFKGAISFGGSATVTDLRKSGETVIWCVLKNTGTDTYDVIGGKA